MEKNESVSIIIATRNEERNIANCLESIKKQNYPHERIEVIVVDNNSADKTKEIASRYTDKVYNCIPQRPAQINLGVKSAKGEYIFFPDADMSFSAGLLAECVSKCVQGEVDALYIPERIIGQGFWIKVRGFERSFYNASCIDCVRFVKKSKFLEIGGFDEDLDFGPDDWDFDRRVRQVARVSITREVVYHNEGEFNLSRYLRKKADYVSSFDKYIQKWGRSDPVIRKQLGFWYRYFGVYLENRKWLKLIRHPILALGLYSLRFMVGVQYLKTAKAKSK